MDYPGLSSSVELTPNGLKWSAIFKITMLPRAKPFAEILAKIHEASGRAGVPDLTVVATGGLPGAKTGFLLHAC